MGFLSLQSIIPPGTIFPYAGSSAPAGWVLCQGQAVSRTSDTYKALFAAIGTAYGQGDLSTTFNLPNTQGYFLRGAGTTGGYSTTRGAVQGDDFTSHTHAWVGLGRAGVGGSTNLFQYGSPGGANNGNMVATNSNTGGTETRPANVGVNYIIKL
jgi:microcystin-dependent protein